MNLIDLETFVLVADIGTMKGAAGRLGVPTSTVSRRVSRLEDGLGLALLRRAHRTFTLTEHGEHLFVRCAPLFDELDGVVRALSDQFPVPRGVLRVTAPQDLGATAFVAEVLTAFMSRWPEVSLDVELTNRRVSLAEEGFDVALRAHGPDIPGSASLMVRRLGISSIGLYASPGYLQDEGAPAEPASLASHRCLANDIYGGRADWTLYRGEGEVLAVGFEASVVANDFGLLLQAAISGAGISALPTFLAGPPLREGRLVRVLPEWRLEGGYLSLLWPRSRHMSPRVRAFIDFMTEAIGVSGDF